MRTLVFITSHFPFGKGETFIESEFPFVVDEFDKVIIISQDVSGEKTRQVPESVILRRYDTSTGVTGFLKLPYLLLRNSGVIREMINSEISFRKRTGKKMDTGKFPALLRKIIKAIQLRDFIADILADFKIREDIVFYSYWLKTGAHAIALLDYPGSIRISRAHGSDIYEEKTIAGYLPLIDFSVQKLDAIFFISANGLKYLTEKLNEQKSGFHLSYLGVENAFGPVRMTGNTGKIVIVSCSNLIPLKRVNLIIEALALTKAECEIEWLHFGDGILKDELESLAGNKLSGLRQVIYRFMGHYSNIELLRFYGNNHIDLFLNTSSTEGLPVSMMEAQSAGIPIIATDVGGVSEIVTVGTGYLIPPDFHPSHLAALIDDHTRLASNEKEVMRRNALNNWEKNFRASVNYRNFISIINSIFATGIQKNRQ